MPVHFLYFAGYEEPFLIVSPYCFRNIFFSYRAAICSAEAGKDRGVFQRYYGRAGCYQCIAVPAGHTGG